MLQLESLIKTPTDDLGKIINAFRNAHHEFLGTTRPKKEEHLINLFNFASKENDSDEKLRFYIYSYIIILQPTPEIITQINFYNKNHQSLLTKHGDLFKTITILCLICRKKKEGNDSFKPSFKQSFVCSLHEFAKQKTLFYSRNALSYVQNLPKLLVSSVPNECLQIFNFFFSFLKPDALSDPAMSLFRDIFQLTKHFKTNPSKDLVKKVMDIFKNGNFYPYPVLYYFFNPWYSFYMQKLIPQTESPDQLEYLANMVEQSLINAESEILHIFQWDICFKLFKDVPNEKIRIKFIFLLFISLKIRSYQPIDQITLKKLEDSSKQFIYLIKDLYLKKILPSLFSTFTQQLIMTINLHTQSLKSIKCIFPPSLFINKSQKKQMFKFSDLSSLKKTTDEIDSHIRIAIEISHSNNIDDIKKWFDIFYKIYKCAILGSLFYSELIHAYFEIIKSDINNSILMFYLSELIQTWIKFMIEISYRASHLQRFIMNELESNGLTERYIQYERRLPDVSNIQSKMQIVFRDIPPFCYQICSDTIISTLARGVKKHIISPFFLTSFEKLINQSVEFRRFLTQKMHQYFFENLSLLTSEDKNDVIFLEQWLLLMIKMKPNDIFLASLMLDSQFQAVSAITSTGRQIIHQNEAINIMIIYSQFIIDNVPPKQLNADRQLNLHKIRRIQLDDLHPAVRVAASTVFINENLFDTSKFYIGIMQLLMFALKSKDDKTRSKAVNLISKYGQNEAILEQYSELVYTFFSVLKTETNEETAKLIFKEIPKFSQNFTAYSNLKHFSDLHSFGKNRIPTFEFLCSIERNMNFNNFESFNLYHLLNFIFHNSSFDQISTECLLKYLSFLGTLSRFHEILPNVEQLFAEIEAYYLEKDPTYYFICLVSISNVSRSLCSDYIIKRIHHFVSLATVESLLTAADRLFQSVPYTNNFFLIIVGLTSLIKKSTNLVRFTHIQTVIKTTDTKISSYYNSFLKLYLSTATPEIKKEFVNYSYKNIGDVFSFYRPQLIKRMRKVGFLINIDKIDFTEDIDYLVCYQTAACLLCGNSNSIPASNDYFKLISRSFQAQDDSKKNYLYWLRGLQLVYAIFKTKCIQFLSMHEFVKIFYTFTMSFINTTFLKSVFPPISKLAKKTIHMVFDYVKNDKKSQQSFDQILLFPEQEKKNILHHKKIINFQLLRIFSKIMPNKVNEGNYLIFFNELRNYSEMNEQQQFLSFLPFTYMMKNLVRIQNKTILVPNITLILSSFGKLFQSQEIPFRHISGKYLRKLISLVQSETVSILCSINREVKNADIVFEFLAEDKSIQKQILYEIEHNDYSRIHPQAFVLMSEIIKNNDDPNLCEIVNLQNLFNNVVRNYEEGSKKVNDEHSILCSVLKSLFIETARRPSFKAIQICSRVFKLSRTINSNSRITHNPEFLESKFYFDFQKLMNDLPREFVVGFINFILSIDKTDPFTLGFLLKLSIKSLLPIDSGLNDTLWNFLLSKLTEEEYLLPVLSCLYLLIKNNEIVKNLLVCLVSNLFIAFHNQNSQLNLIGFKISCKLIELKLLPTEIHQAIAIHLLSFPKFFESIYSPYTSFIISKLKEPYIIDLNDALTLFITDNLMARKDMGKIIFITQYFPNIQQCLPFELLSTLIDILQTLIQNNTDPVQIEVYFMSILKMIPYLKESEDIMATFSKRCYEFLYKALKNPDVIKNFPNHFFQFILPKDSLYAPFPEELVKEIDSFKVSNFFFAFICFILKFAPFRLIATHYDSIRKKIDINNEYVIFYSKYFISASLKSPEMMDKFLPSVESIIEKSKTNRETMISNVISSAPLSKRFLLLEEFYKNKLIGEDMCFMLLKKLDCEQQIIFIQRIFSNPNRSSFCQNIYQVIKSNEVANTVKSYILYQMVKSEDLNNIQVTYKIINFLFNIYFNNTETTTKVNRDSLIPNVQIYIIRLSVVISYLVDQKSRLVLFDICIKLLQSQIQNENDDDDEVLRFILLLQSLKNKLWNDKCLPFIILLINGEKNQSLIAFSNLLSNCSQVSRYTFERLLRNDKCPNLRDFYVKCLKNGNKQVIKDLTIAFQNNKIRISDDLNWKASKYSIFCDFDLSTYSNPRILYPNTFADYRFGTMLPYMTKNEMITTINFLLTNYVDNFCNYDLNDDQNGHFSSPLLESIFKESCGLYKTINENTIDYSYFFKFDKFNDILDVNLVESMTMNAFQIHNNLTRFELERIVAIETIVQLQNDGGLSLKLIDINRNLNSYFVSIINKCASKISNKIDKQDCQINNSNNNQPPYLILAPLFQSLFKRISGYTKHGYIVLTIGDIDFSLSSFHLFNSTIPRSFVPSAAAISATVAAASAQASASTSLSSIQTIPMPIPISNVNPNTPPNQTNPPIAPPTNPNDIVLNAPKINMNLNSMNGFNRYKWACFMFNMFMNTPSVMMANSTIHNLFCCIDDNSLSTIHKFETATRAITVLRLCVSDPKRNVVVTDSSKKIPKNGPNLMRLWTSQLLHIARNDTFRHAKRIIFYESSSLMTRYSIDRPEILQKELIQFDINARKNFPVLIEFHNFLNYLFNCNEIEFSNNNDQVLRINSRLPLSLPSRNYRVGPNIIIRIHGNTIKRCSQNMIILNAATYSSPSAQFIIERVNKPNEAASFSNALLLLNLSLKSSYSASSRSIVFNSHLGFEIGHEYVIYDAPRDLKLLSEFESFVSSNDEDIELDSTFSPLCALYSSSPFPESFFARRQSFVRSLTCNQFLRNLFCLPQTGNCMFSNETFKAPVIIGDFHVPPVDESIAERFSFHISCENESASNPIETDFDNSNNENDPCQRLKRVLGPSLDGEVMMTVAALSKSLSDNIECLRSVLEVLAFDGIENANTDSIRNVADGFQERLMWFTPPDPDHASNPDYQEWIDDLLCFIGKEERKSKRSTMDSNELNDLANPIFGFNSSNTYVTNTNIDSNANMQMNNYGTNAPSNDNINGGVDLNQFDDHYLGNVNIINGNQNKFDDFDSSIQQDRSFDDDNLFF